jgi:hypothetical protein
MKFKTKAELAELSTPLTYEEKKLAEQAAENARYYAEGIERRASACRMEEEQLQTEAARLEASNRAFAEQTAQQKLGKETEDAVRAKEDARYRDLAEKRIAEQKALNDKRLAEEARLRSLMEGTPEARAARNVEADRWSQAKAAENRAKASSEYASELEAQERQSSAAKADFIRRGVEERAALQKIHARKAQQEQVHSAATTKPCASCGASVPKESALHLRDGVACFSDFEKCLAAEIITLEVYNKLTTKVHA